VILDYSFNSTRMSCNLTEFCTDFLQWFRSDSFVYFSSLFRRSNISIRNTLERIHGSYAFSENDSKRKITLAEFERVEAAYISRTIFVIYNYLKRCVWLLLVAVTPWFPNLFGSLPKGSDYVLITLSISQWYLVIRATNFFT